MISPLNIEAPKHIQAIYDKIASGEHAEETPCLTEAEVWNLLLWEAEQGGATLEDLREIRRTANYPPGLDNIWIHSALLLLGMAE